MNLDSFLSNVLKQAAEKENLYWKAKLFNADYGRAHMAIMIEPYLSWVLSGKKTIESRFSQRRIAPYDKVKKRDIILLKKSGGNIMGVFEAGSVYYYDSLDPYSISALKNQYNEKICGSDEFWQSRQICKYAALIEINALFVLEPIKVKYKNRSSWIVGD